MDFTLQELRLSQCPIVDASLTRNTAHNPRCRSTINLDPRGLYNTRWCLTKRSLKAAVLWSRHSDTTKLSQSTKNCCSFSVTQGARVASYGREQLHPPRTTMEHIVNDCPLRLFSGGLAGLSGLEDGSLNWLSNLDLAL
ncbi:hypothetical protein J6590_085608 [Homalodisca vitripennis]|nr:hypothetical protein J6590_085608 [Homalodisca vitripennis]